MGPIIRPFRYHEELGRGAYGKVVRGSDLSTGQQFAIKIIIQKADEDTPFTAIREAAILKYLAGHRRIISLRHYFYTEQELALAFDLMPYDLAAYMDRKPNRHMRLEQVLQFTHQMLEGVAFCHEMKILHRDLKPQNILISQDSQLQIADFGLACSFMFPKAELSSEVVTMCYRAPDVLKGSVSYGPDIDIWSAGCILAEMYTGDVIFRASSPENQLQLIREMLSTNFVFKHFELLGEGVDLLAQMLDWLPANRCSAAKALQHRYFAEITRTSTNS